MTKNTFGHLGYMCVRVAWALTSCALFLLNISALIDSRSSALGSRHKFFDKQSQWILIYLIIVLFYHVKYLFYHNHVILTISK